MIALRRLEEPAVLAENKARWLTAFMQARSTKPGKRPSSSQYAHPDVVTRLERMSFNKCFYCEHSTKAMKKNVDHHIDVAERPDLAFEWTNLYLSCCDCNLGKPSNQDIPVAECVDPCDGATDPAEHLTFHADLIAPRDGSVRGRRTIQKYRLDRGDLDRMRAHLLVEFLKTLTTIAERRIRDGGRPFTAEERSLLLEYAQPERPFALMFRVFFRQDLPELLVS